MAKPVIDENVPLAPLTTFKIGGPARYFVTVKTTAELKAVLAIAKEKGWPILILADGSNLIVSDQGFDGLVIRVGINGWKIEGQQLTSGPATSMADLVDAAITAELSGLEWAGGLPGSFGGAIRGNAGCFGGEMKDIVVAVTSINIGTGQQVTRDHAACQFEYRGSFFKHHPEVIVSATLKLQPGERQELRRVADEHIRYRQEKHPLEYPNAGSIFKNVPLQRVPANHLALFAEAIKNDPFPIVPTAKIIAVAGLKGLRVGDAQVSEKHSNYMVNLGRATAADLVALIEKVKAEIKAKYQVELEVEPELVGFSK